MNASVWEEKEESAWKSFDFSHSHPIWCPRWTLWGNSIYKFTLLSLFLQFDTMSEIISLFFACCILMSCISTSCDNLGEILKVLNFYNFFNVDKEVAPMGWLNKASNFNFFFINLNLSIPCQHLFLLHCQHCRTNKKKNVSQVREREDERRKNKFFACCKYGNVQHDIVDIYKRNSLLFEKWFINAHF